MLDTPAPAPPPAWRPRALCSFYLSQNHTRPSMDPALAAAGRSSCYTTLVISCAFPSNAAPASYSGFLDRGRSPHRDISAPSRKHTTASSGPEAAELEAVSGSAEDCNQPLAIVVVGAARLRLPQGGRRARDLDGTQRDAVPTHSHGDLLREMVPFLARGHRYKSRILRLVLVVSTSLPQRPRSVPKASVRANDDPQQIYHGHPHRRGAKAAYLQGPWRLNRGACAYWEESMIS